MKRISACFFSATGTTKKIVEQLANTLSQKLKLEVYTYDFTLKKNREQLPTFEKEDLIIIGTPVIAGRVPNLLLPFLQKIKAESTYAIPIVLYGNRNYDDALIELSLLMQAAGSKVIAGGAFIGEHSFSTVLGAKRPDREDMEVLDEFATKILQKINASELKSVDLPGNKLLPAYYQPRDRHGSHIDIRKVKPKTNENCTNCMLCANICPLSSISFEDVRRIPGICMKCCACIKRCPEQAKYFDDEGYLYHKIELEEQYAHIRRKPEYYI